MMMMVTALAGSSDDASASSPASWLVFAWLCVFSLWAFPAILLVVWGWLSRRRAAKAKGAMLGALRIAHRGGRERDPENTLESFRRGAKHCDALELDVWLTRDKQVVVLHDGTLERVTGVKGHVNDTNYEDLPRVWRKPSDGWDQGSGSEDETLSSRIPLLSEVLDAHPHSGFIVEFKEASCELVDKVHDMLTERKLISGGKVVWFGLKDHFNAALAARDDSIPRICSVAEVLKATLMYHMGVLRACPLPFSIFGVKVGDARKMLGLARKIPVSRWIPQSLLLQIINWVIRLVSDPGLARFMRKRGVPVYVLGVNDQKAYGAALNMGGTAVLTDRPLWLRTYMQSLSRGCRGGLLLPTNRKIVWEPNYTETTKKIE